MSGFVTELINDQLYVKCYTDGSCLYPSDCYLAIGGWALYFFEGSILNTSAPLRCTVQSSYLAEVRGVAEALATASCPLIIYCDCQSVVNQVNRFINFGHRSTDHALAPDLWEFIYDALSNGLPKDWVVCRWMPGHLDAKDKRTKRDTLLRDGAITWDDIRGNMSVDRMADTAARRHEFSTFMHQEADIRKRLTSTIQRHLVKSWLTWCDLHRGIRGLAAFNECDVRRHDQDLDDLARDEQGQYLDDWLGFDPSLDDPFANLLEPEMLSFDDCPDELDAPFGMIDMDGCEIPAKCFLKEDTGAANRDLTGPARLLTARVEPLRISSLAIKCLIPLSPMTYGVAWDSPLMRCQPKRHRLALGW